MEKLTETVSTVAECAGIKLDDSAETKTAIAVATGVVVAVGAIALVRAVSTPRKAKRPIGNNPFQFDSREAAKGFEFDHAKRDAVLKYGYSQKKLLEACPDGDKAEFDAIVIGSGIGGLTTAALLAKAGQRVLVLEQHDQCGGCCHSFMEKGYEFDTGIHLIGEMRNNTAVRFLFDQLSRGHLKWADIADDFDTVVLVDDAGGDGPEAMRRIDAAVKSGTPMQDTFQVAFRTGEEETIQSLLAAFPGEEPTIRKYFTLLAKTRKAMLGFVALKVMPEWLGNFMVRTGLVNFITDFFKMSGKSLTKTLEELTPNKKLRAVLAYNYGDYGTIPKDAPFTMHAILQNHFMKGASFPLGGSSEIAYHIVPNILKAGGRVFVRAEVDKILTDPSGSTATGVRLKRDGMEVYAPVVISAAGVFVTQKLLPDVAKPRFYLSPQNKVSKAVRHGTGGMSVYIGLRGSSKELGLEGKNYWVFWTKKGAEDLDAIAERFLGKSRSDILKADSPVPLLFISFPSAKNPLWDERFPGKSTATVITLAQYDWFSEWEDKRVMHRGPEYEQLKKALGDVIWRQTLALFPHLQDKVEYFDVGTPVTNKYYLGAMKGEMYGADHNKERFSAQTTVSLRPDSKIGNLYLSGQDVFSAGFVGAAFGGLFCASSVLGRNVYGDLQELKARSKPSIVNSNNNNNRSSSKTSN